MNMIPDKSIMLNSVFMTFTALIGLVLIAFVFGMIYIIFLYARDFNSIGAWFVLLAIVLFTGFTVFQYVT